MLCVCFEKKKFKIIHPLAAKNYVSNSIEQVICCWFSFAITYSETHCLSTINVHIATYLAQGVLQVVYHDSLYIYIYIYRI